MKSLLHLFAFIVFFNQSFALDKNLENQLLTTATQQVLEAQQLIDEVGRDKIADVYFQKLQESYAALAQLKAEPVEEKTQQKEINSIFSSLHAILYPQQQLQKSMTGTGSGVIRGFVLSALTGESIPNQNVRLYDGSGNFIQSVTTDNVGRYTFIGLTSGPYVLIVDVWSNFTYIDTAYPSTGCNGGLGQGCQISDLTIINLAADEVLEDINVSLIAKSTISGHVSDASDGSILRRTVRVKLYNLSLNRVSTAYTDNQGDYSLTVPSEGDYYVVATVTGYFDQLFDNVQCTPSCDYSLGGQIHVVESQNVGAIDFALQKYANISGVVSDMQLGNVISGARIRTTITNTTYGQTYTDTQGQWEMSLPPGDYQINASQTDFLAEKYSGFTCTTSDYRSCSSITGTIVSHNVIDDTGIDIALDKGAKISGVVTNTLGVPITYANISVYTQFNEQLVKTQQIYTNALGEFETPQLSNGSYYLVANKANYEAQLYNHISCATSLSCNLSLGMAVPIVNANDVTGIDFQLIQKGSISGRVLDEQGSPVPYTNVYFRNTDGYSYSAQTENDGTYNKEGLDSGEFQVYVAELNQFMPETYNNIICDDEYCQNENYTPVFVNVNTNIGNIDFQLSKKGKVTFDLQSNSMNPLGNDFYMEIFDTTGQFLSRSYSTIMWLNEGDYYFLYKTYSSSPFVKKVYGGANCFSNCDVTTGLLVHVTSNSEQTLAMNVDEKFHLNVTANVGGIFSQLYNQSFIGVNNFYLPNVSASTSYYFNDLDSKYLKFTKQGFYSQIYDNLSCLEVACDVSQGQLIVPQLNASLNINLVLTPLVSLSGRITDSFNNPVEGVNVIINSSLTQNDYLGYAQTDANGEYTIFGVTPGDVYILVESGWNHPEFVSRTYYGNIGCEENDCSNLGINPVALNQDDVLVNMDIQMVSRGTLSGSGIVNVFNQTQPVNIVAYSVIDGVVSNSGTVINSINGLISPIHLRAGEYKLVANPNYETIYTAYPDTYCSNSSCAPLADSVNITNGNNTHINSFVVHQSGRIKGVVRDVLTSNALENIKIKVYQNGSIDPVSSFSSNADGEFEFNITPNVQYKIMSAESEQWESNNNKYIPQLYNNIDCAHGLGVDCVISQGDTLNATYDTIMTININLKLRPQIRVWFKDAVSNKSIRMNTVTIYNESGSKVYRKYTNSSTSLLIDDLLPGGYYLMVSSGEFGFKDTAYPDVYCPSYDTLNCDLNLLTPITLTQGASLQNIYVKAPMLDGISGYVIDEQTGLGLQGVVLDSWRDNGDYYNSPVISEFNGGFSIYTGNQSSSYYLSTDTNSAYINEVYKDIECQQPAILGSCDVTQGMLVEVPQNNLTPIIVNIELSTNSNQLFRNGFE